MVDKTLTLFERLLHETLNEEFAPVYRDEKYVIMVYNEPFGNPSFHFYYKNEWSIVLQIKDLQILKVKYGKFNKGQQLPNSIKKDLYKIFNKFYIKDITIWEHIIGTWNLCNRKYPISLNTPIP